MSWFAVAAVLLLLPSGEGVLRRQAFQQRLVLQPDLVPRDVLLAELLDSVCIDTRKQARGSLGVAPALDGTRGLERAGRLCKLQGLVIQRTNVSGEVRQQLLRVSNLGSTEEELFTTSLHSNISMGAITEAEARELCANAQTYDVPLVITSRDHSNLFHTMGSQLLPLYAALARFNLQHVKFKTVFVNDWPRVHGNGDESSFLGVYEAVSGGVRPETLEQLPDVVCAETVIVGIEPQYLVPFDYNKRLEYGVGRHRWASVLFSGYIDWVLSAYRLEQPDVPDEKAGLVLIVTRTAGRSRQVGGSNALAELVRQRGWRVRVVDTSALSIRKQLEAVLTASIFISVHGSAMTLAAFLPERAVAVELMPVGFGIPPHVDMYHGYSNFLDVAGVSHIVWHDQQGMRDPFGGGKGKAGASRECGKQAHVLLDNAAMVQVFSAAEKVWHTHPRDREKSKVVFLNGPQKCPGTGKP